MAYRILYHQRTQDADGQRVHIREIQDGLRRLGHHVEEVSPVRAAEQAGDHLVSTRRRRLLGTVSRLAPKGAYELLQWAYNGYAYLALTRAIRQSRPDFIYERYALNTIAGVLAARRFGIPLLLEVNSPLAEEQYGLGKVMFYGVARRTERFVLRRATKVLAVTGVLRDRLCRQASLDAAHVLVVQNGVRTEAFVRAAAERDATRHSLGVEGAVVVGAVAFFHRWHGVEMLIDCIARNPVLRDAVALLLVGDGPALPELKLRVANHGLDRHVVFTGPIPHDRIPALMSAMDVAVLPKAVDYASPLKLFEYMAAGAAIVAPRQPNLLEVVTEGHDAVCFAPEDGAELEGALQRLVQDPLLRGRLGAAARATIERGGYTWDGNAGRIVNAFEQVANIEAAPQATVRVRV